MFIPVLTIARHWQIQSWSSWIYLTLSDAAYLISILTLLSYPCVKLLLVSPLQVLKPKFRIRITSAPCALRTQSTQSPWIWSLTIWTNESNVTNKELETTKSHCTDIDTCSRSYNCTGLCAQRSYERVLSDTDIYWSLHSYRSVSNTWPCMIILFLKNSKHTAAVRSRSTPVSLPLPCINGHTLLMSGHTLSSATVMTVRSGRRLHRRLQGYVMSESSA
jgi:hypothetical protein